MHINVCITKQISKLSIIQLLSIVTTINGKKNNIQIDFHYTICFDEYSQENNNIMIFLSRTMQSI